MKRIGLIDCDGRKFPNLALMRISAWHKSQGDEVEWHYSLAPEYDIVYMSKVFGEEYSKRYPIPCNAKTVVQGGTGFAITIVNGKEVYDKNKDHELPEYIEKMFPDYSIYPEFSFAVSMTSRGCPRGCQFCHVGSKEGRCAKKVANVSDFWDGQKEIKVLDANLTAVKEKRDLFAQYRDTGAYIDYTQGLDIRLLDDNDIRDLNATKIRNIHFAWDSIKDDLTNKFKNYASKATHKPHGQYGTVYVLTNYDSTHDDDMRRVNTLLKMGFDPYVMIYRKQTAPQITRDLQRWCNSVCIRKKCLFTEYTTQKR